MKSGKSQNTHEGKDNQPLLPRKIFDLLKEFLFHDNYKANLIEAKNKAESNLLDPAQKLLF